MASIKRPGVEVTQENVTATTTISAPDLTTVIVGPCYQIVDAFDDSGVAQAEALAGTYQDGKGTIAYALPGLKTGGLVTSSSVRAFRVDGAGASTELRDSDNEETITTGTAGVYQLAVAGDATAPFSDSTASFVSSGVQKGDFIRFTYRGESVDLEITDTVSVNTSVTVASGIDQIAGDAITGISYSVVRNPPQFLYKASAEQADVEIGAYNNPETDYVTIAVSSSAASTLTGAAGDAYNIQVQESAVAYSATHTATGTAVATGTDIGTQFLTLNGSAGAAAVSTLAANGYALIYLAGGASPIGATNALATAVAGAGEANTVVLSTATALGGTPKGVVGKINTTPETGNVLVYDHTGHSTGERVVLFQSAHGISSTTNVYVYIETGSGGSGTGGLYAVDAVINSLTLQLGSSSNPGGDVTNGTSGALLMPVTLTGSTVVALTAGSDAIVYDYSATTTSHTVLGTSGSASVAIVFGSDTKATAAYQAGVTVSATGRQYALGAALTSGGSPGGTAVTDGASGRQAQFVQVSAPVAFDIPSTGTTYKVTLARDAKGKTTTTGAALKTALELISDFSSSFTIAVTGSPTYTYLEADTVREGQTVAGVHPLDGGTDADSILVDADLIGSSSATHSIYVSYKALRVDVSDQASSPALTDITSTTDVTTSLGVISTDNPLALAAYFGTLQSPLTTLKCLGVSAVSTTEPAGTTAAYTSALEYLEGQDVYSVVCLSTDPAIQALFETHVETMSSAANKSERIAWVSQDMPTHTTATLLSSGTSGDTGANFATDGVFETNVDFSLNAALTTVLADTASDDLILVVTAKSASTAAPTAANGVIPARYGVRINKSTTTTQHASDSSKLMVLIADAGAAAALDGTWANAVAVTWSLYQMGTALSTTAEKAAAVGDLGTQFANKRVFLAWPNSATASISGTATVVGGEYLAAAWGAKVGFDKPEAPFTNTTITGFSGLSNSNTLFTRSQLDAIAGGGTWITVQDSPSAALSCRHQLSTLVTTIQNRELSITKTVDYVAKRLRQVLEPKIGSFRITQSYLDTLGLICEGEIRNFVETGVLTTGAVNFVEVDSTNSDQVNIQVIITVPFPANYIALTLQF